MGKLTVVGAGKLGSCIAYEVANRGLVNELVLIDLYRELAEENAEDIKQSLAFRNGAEVYAGDYGDAEGSDVVVIAAGKPRTPDMKSRMDLIEVNQKIIRAVASNLKSIGGEFVVVTLTNPLDVMNYLVWRYTGFDRSRVIGSAGQLDSSRFRCVLSRRLKVSVLDIDAFVIGEHGDDQVPVFSRVRVKGKPVRFTDTEKIEICEELKKSALNVISKKGATIFAPANNTANIIQAILKDEKKLAVCSAILDGEYGLSGVSIGVPAILGRSGVEAILEWRLSEDERLRFEAGAEKLRRSIEQLIGSN